MVNWLKMKLSQKATLRWILSGLYNHHFFFCAALIKSIVANYRLTGKIFKIQVRIGANQSLTIIKAKSAKVMIKGLIEVNSWGGSRLASSIVLFDNAEMHILGDFIIGPGVHISLSNNAVLEIGGRKISSGSGITSNSRIMVEKRVKIGFDTIIAWDTYITDSNWHDIVGLSRTTPTIIGNNVWISHGVSILKGAQIPNGCIVGAKSLVLDHDFHENSLIAGIPAKNLKQGLIWTR